MNTSTDTIGSVLPARLRCEALTDPLAVASSRPRLSWIVESSERDQVQAAYQVLAASDPDFLARDEGDLWDSGKVTSDETLNIEYEGRPLESAQRCWWKVRTWDKSGLPSAWSAAAVFGAGLESSDWKADWIGFDKTRDLDLPPAPFDGAKWIWLGDRETNHAEAAFVGTLHLPEDVTIEHSQIAISVAGKYRFYWRGEQFGMSDGEPESWRRPYIRHMNERLRPGINEFLIKAEKIANEPPGVLFKAFVRATDGRTFTQVSDDGWCATQNLKDDSEAANTSTDAEKTAAGTKSIASDWPACRVIANHGDAPWGIIRGVENFLPPPAWLRGSFNVASPVRRATLFATALGAYDVHLNGIRVNNSHFDPGWTDYKKRLYYRAFDVTTSLRTGENVLGAILADGWFRGYIGWGHQRDVYGKQTRFRGQLHIEYLDGRSQVIGTDLNWRAVIGPIKEADMLMGEVHDARDEMPGWDSPGFDDSGWQPVDTGVKIHPELQPHPAPPVVPLEGQAFVPCSITEPVHGVFIFDLGQNFAGIARLKVRHTVAGQKLVLRFGERLNADGSLYTVNLRTARATDTYICRGGAEEVWSPRFTFHGFQYVEVSGLTARPDAQTITGIPLSTDTPMAGTFECSDTLANRLASNVYWSQRSNFIEIPTDCPQRDERLGWCDAAWTFVGAGSLRTDVQTFYNKWTTDLDDAQWPDGLYPWLAPLVVTKPDISGPMWAGCSPAWSDAGVICPWAIHKIYGDRRQLAEHYPAMVRQVEWYRKTSRPNLLPPETHKCLGDWLNYNAPIPTDVFRTAFFAYSTGLVASSAKVLGKTDDAARYGKLHHEINTGFQREYVDADGRILGDTQSGYAFALLFGLLADDQVAKAAEHLVTNIRDNGWRPTTGMEATLPMMLALAQIGRNDVAYRLLHSEEFPSWNFSIKNGATTIWERWDSWTPERGFGDPNMNSFNHFSLGAVYQWMAENIGGIQQADIGYKHLVIAPTPGGKLTSARVSYDSVRGMISTNWKLSGDLLDLKVQIPANTSAKIVLPAHDARNVTESGVALSKANGIRISDQQVERVSLELGSGLYHFQIQRAVLADIT